MSARAGGADDLLVGEWACLGAIADRPAHGFAVAARLAPSGDIGRVWSVSRPLTYRSIAQLAQRGHIRPVMEEPGIAGGTRTVYAVTSSGRDLLGRWLAEPVAHLRDLRSELLLKLVLAQRWGIDNTAMLVQQREAVVESVAAHADRVADPGPGSGPDVVTLWRLEASRAALHFLDGVLARRAHMSCQRECQ